MLDISIITNDSFYVRPSKFLPSSEIARKDLYPDREFFILKPAIADTSKIDGKTCFITSKKYSINKKQYDISEGYAIEAIVTSKYEVFPVLRKAFGKETKVQKDKNGFGILDYWPKITLAPEKTIQIEKKSTFTEEVSSFYIENESFSFSIEESEEW